MIERVVFIGDLNRGEQADNVVRMQRLFSPVLKQLNVASFLHVSEINRCSRLEEWLGAWRQSLDDEQNRELDAADLIGAAVIGFELPGRDLEILTARGIRWVNFEIHPLRFLDDLYFEVRTSFPGGLDRHSAGAGLVEFCVQSLRSKYPFAAGSRSPDTLAIFGQAPFDRSVYFDGQFHRLDSYLDRLDDLVGRHCRVLYRPHPYMTDANIDRLILQRYSAELSSDRDVYGVLINQGIKTACAISSSIISEVPHFGILGEYLEPRAKRFGPAVSYRALLDDQSFWSEGLLGRGKELASARISVAVPENYLRRVFASWGYVTDKQLNDERVTAVEKSVNDIHGRLVAVEGGAKMLGEVMAGLRAAPSEIERRLAVVESAVRSKEAELVAMRSSRSWRVTAPLRRASAILSRLRDSRKWPVGPAALRIRCGSLAVNVAERVRRDPRLSRIARAVLVRFPRARVHLQRALAKYGVSGNASRHVSGMDGLERGAPEMGRAANRVFRQLKEAQLARSKARRD